MGSLDGVSALVTGGGQGLGRGIALGLAERGADVGVVDVDVAAARSVAAEVEQGGTRATFADADITDEAGIASAIDQIWGAIGGLDLLVNNAGVLSVSPVLDMDAEEWRRVLEVNATGTFLASRAVARRLVAEGRPGSIVSIASIAGKRGDPLLAHYSASKFAIVGLTQALARELAEHDVTVNAVCPGLVETQMIEQVAKGWNISVEGMLDAQAIHRPQTADEIADAVAFLHRNRSVTGQAINVDGGTVFD